MGGDEHGTAEGTMLVILTFSLSFFLFLLSFFIFFAGALCALDLLCMGGHHTPSLKVPGRYIFV